jgi:hypothetical protein
MKVKNGSNENYHILGTVSSSENTSRRYKKSTKKSWKNTRQTLKNLNLVLNYEIQAKSLKKMV